MIKFETSHGHFTVELFTNEAPLSAGNFRKYVADEYFDGTIFHRIIPGFMIQGGDPLGTGTGGPGYVFDDEINPELDFTEPYILAMANAGQRGGHGTNGSQFFITVGATTWLQGKHTIFGAVEDADSRAIVDKLAELPTDASDRPLEDVVIESVSVEQV
jgi:peptidyl-prolyl cis-trans isomerase A (cyclophilin A)